MIISASRRTDIPAFYAEWLMDSLYKGEFCIPNPYNHKQLKKLSISKENIDGFVFWTKYPISFLRIFNEFKKFGFPFYFQYTINPYDSSLEPGLTNKKAIVNLFIKLSDLIGPTAIYWRYDPIIFYSGVSITWHLQKIEEFAAKLKGFTNICIASFYTDYIKCSRKMHGFNIDLPSAEAKYNIIQSFRLILQSYNIELRLCADEDNCAGSICSESKCIDNEIFNQVFGKDLTIEKDKNQRANCLCSKSFDIGKYKTCKFGCLYCYAS